jgi:hypothetical protein
MCNGFCSMPGSDSRSWGEVGKGGLHLRGAGVGLDTLGRVWEVQQLGRGQMWAAVSRWLLEHWVFPCQLHKLRCAPLTCT